jgi:hypothetical protein
VIEIKDLTLKINDTEIKITFEDLRKLHSILTEMFGSDDKITYLPYPVYLNPTIFKPVEYPDLTPIIICESGVTPLTVGDGVIPLTVGDSISPLLIASDLENTISIFKE